MTLSELRALLRSRIGNPSTGEVPDPMLDLLLNEAQRDIADRYPFEETRCLSTFETVAGTSRYNLPPDLSAIRRLWIDGKGRIHRKTERYLAVIPEGVPNGVPKAYVRIKNWVQLVPVPDAVYTVSLYYTATSTDMVEDTDEPILPINWHIGLVHYARYIYYDSRQDFAKAQAMLGKWNAWVMTKSQEIDEEKEDNEFAGVVIPTLGDEYGRQRGRVRRFGRFNRFDDY